MSTFSRFPNNSEKQEAKRLRYKRLTCRPTVQLRQLGSTFTYSAVKGDILICTSTNGSSGSSGESSGCFGGRSGQFMGSVRRDYIGHAALIISEFNVLEMVGTVARSQLDSNNTLTNIKDWFHGRKNHYFITIYRCPDSVVANTAADWAYQNYYNDTGGLTKTKHVAYKLATRFATTDRSYCSKLLLQAYHYGNPEKNVIDYTRALIRVSPIVPNKIPSYFMANYALEKICAGTYFQFF